MKKYISILTVCLFAIAFHTHAQDSSMANSNEHHCCKKDTAGKTCDMAHMKTCKHDKKACCKKDAMAKSCNMTEMKKCANDDMAACCSKDKSHNAKACCMKEGSKARCESDKKEKSKMKDCPMHKG